MTARSNLIGGVMLGAGMMYLLDPDKGNRRRARVRDQFAHLTRKTEGAAGATTRDLSNRARGMVAGARSRVRREEVADNVVEARVRSRLGRLVSHPGAIAVRAENGRVSLSGPILEHEVESLISGVHAVKGVREVENQLEPHAEAGDIPGLQGDRPRREPRFELRQQNWAPGPRFIAGMVGSAMALQGIRRRGPLSPMLALAGFGLLSRAVTNLEMKRLSGISAGRRAIDIHKTINIRAPVEEVFRFWSNYENFPRFMGHLKEVTRTGEGLSHWVAEGPGGVPVSWDAETTGYIENEIIAWKSVGGTPVGNAGIVRFQPNPDGSTRVDIRMSYNPPAGAIGHAVAAFFGADPKRAMDEDLVRMQSLIELGKTSAHGKQVAREHVDAASQ